MILGDLVFCVHLVVLFQSCCTIVTVSGKTSSTPTAAGSEISGSTTATSRQRSSTVSSRGYGNPPPLSTMQKYNLPGELGESCSAIENCRQYAYVCDSRKQTCECADGYQPDEARKTCVGAINKRCLYDSHCITNAYCKGQMICTCKREFGYLSEDKSSCQASAADSPLHRKSAGLVALLLGVGGGAIIIPLLLVSSWQLEINLFTV